MPRCPPRLDRSYIPAHMLDAADPYRQPYWGLNNPQSHRPDTSPQNHCTITNSGLFAPMD